MKENQPYDEKRYTQALRNMVQQCIDYEDTHEILTEWDEWDKLVQDGYEAQADQNYEKMLLLWWKAWEIFQKIVETAEYKISISGLMESQDYQYPIDAWLQDLEMEPHNQNALSVWSWCVQEEQGAEEAYRIIRREVIGIGCTMENELLFERARLLAQHLEKAEDLKWIEPQLEAFSDALEKAELYNDLYDDFAQPIQQPIVKEKKVYPNDPCPCGSGKKYKQCCGK